MILQGRERFLIQNTEAQIQKNKKHTKKQTKFKG